MIRSMLRRTSVAPPPSVIPLANIIEYWNMNGNGNGYNGNNQAGALLTYPSSTLIDEACQYGSAGNAIGAINNDSGIFSFGNGTTDSPFSVSFWVKWDTVGTDFLFSIRGTGTDEYEIIQVSNSIRTRFFSNNNDSIYKQVSKSTTFSAGTWYNIGMSYSGSGFQKVYINGSRTSNSASTVGTYVAMNGNNGNLNLGGVTFNTSFTLQGQLDEVAIYNIELSDSQFTDIYNAGLAGTPIIG